MIEKLIGDYPKIGIRPVIDARSGEMRKSLEQQTMNQAIKVAEFLRNNLRYADGAPAKVVISNSTIGGVSEASWCAEQFRKENVTVTITVTSSWCSGTEIMDMNPLTQKAIWGFNGTERLGAVCLNSINAAYNAFGFSAFSIYSKDVQDKEDGEIPADVKKKLLIFSKAALVVGTIQNKSYLSIGSVSMGTIGSFVSQSFFQKYLGMRNEYVDMVEIKRRIAKDIYDKNEYKKAKKWVNLNLKMSDWDKNKKEKSESIKKSVISKSIKMALIVKDLMVGNPELLQNGWQQEGLGHNAILSGFQGQKQWTDFMPNGDFMEAILNTTFDWNGRREPYLVATENDSLNGVAMLFSHLITDSAQIFAKLRTYWSPSAIERITGWKPTDISANGFIHLSNSGPAALDGSGVKNQSSNPVIKPWYEQTKNDVKEIIEDTSWHMSSFEYFKGGGLSTRLRTKGGMSMTITKISLTASEEPYIQIIEGYSVELPKEVHDILDKRTDPTWPTTLFVPIKGIAQATSSPYEIMNNWGSEHCSISAGHIGEELIALAAMLRIPVTMHNIADARIFRPKAWMNFGTRNLESADYLACKTFGPLYGNNMM